MGIKTIYIDWNLYSILKNPKLKPHIILADLLKESQDNIRLVYSDAHLGDLTQTSKDKGKLLEQDLKYLTDKTQSTCIVNYRGDDRVIIDQRDALEFHNQNIIDNSGLQQTNILTNSIFEQYSGQINKIMQEYFKLDPGQVSNLKLKQIEELVIKIGLSSNIKDFFSLGLQLRSASEKLGYMDYYITAYTNLDMINYSPDSKNGSRIISNLLNDSKHSGYGTLCDAFITNDNKCYIKSKLLFDYFDSKSTLFRTCKVKNIDKYITDLKQILGLVG